jgi:hypothetical protein
MSDPVPQIYPISTFLLTMHNECDNDSQPPTFRYANDVHT